MKRKRMFFVFPPAAAAVLGLALHVVASPRYSDWSAPVNIGPTINTAYFDAQPALSKDGLSLYFSSNRPGGYGGADIMVSRRACDQCPWGTPANLGPTANTAAHEQGPALSRDGHVLFFHSNRPGGSGGDDIWFSTRTNTHDDLAWTAPVNAGPGVNSAFNDWYPSFFENDETGVPQLYFNSNRPNPANYSGHHIYVSHLTPSGSWGPAVLAPGLYGPVSDAGADIRFDGLEIFFFSNRPGSPFGPGNIDIWASTRNSVLDPWSAPVNQGIVNSAQLDSQPAISPDRLTVYFNVSKPGGFGGEDIYMSTRTKVTGE